jgi:hypothetical protein
MKLLLTILFVMFVASNTYAQDENWSWGEVDAAKLKGGAVEYIPPKKLKRFPAPSLLFVNDKEELRELREEVEDKIIYPFLCESEVPILSITVDLCPAILGAEGERGCVENGDNPLMIRLDVSGADGSESMRMLERNKGGSVGKDAYLKLLPQGFVPKRKCKGGEGEN